MGDTGEQDLSSSIEDKHFSIVNEKGDHNVNVNAKIQNTTKALLDEESGKRTASIPESRVQSSAMRTMVDVDNDQNHGISKKRKRTESPDSEIVVIDDDDDEHPRSTNEYDPSIDEKLPETVTLLTTPDGGKLYLIGTAHFSIESQNDVSTIIQAVQPHIVMVELCKARIHILELDEQAILEGAKNLTFQSICDTIQQNGLYNGLMYMLLLNMSAYLTKELGMAPGGEFRRAFIEAKKVPNCVVHMGDRPIRVTLHRALSLLSWRQTLKLGWYLLTSKDPISKEEVERCKRRDLLEKMLAEMAGEFPALGEVFVKERDIYLTHSLQLACLPQRTSHGVIPARVVGVVGIGHMPGIIKHWGKVKPSEIPPIMRYAFLNYSINLCYKSYEEFEKVIFIVEELRK